MNDNVFLNQIVSAVSKKLTGHSERPITSNWKFYDRAEPTVSSEVVPENTQPPPHFNNRLCENDLNDSFDEIQLLRFVPKRFFKKAKTLLEIFDERPDEITWDSTGNIYIDQASIPNGNIYRLFPYLFRQKVPKDVITKGFPDLVQKLVNMNLQHLLNCNLSIGERKKIKEESLSRPQAETDKKEASKSSKWWLLT